ncbi:MAG: glutamate/gamma-aminobutyrate family transporter YjeM [Lactobacillus sp.]|nr:glutamate/gamma-aminobutyrate family transporter YjeM [Lactobacillus sp.]MCI1481332.1 glutamate/gamma-aminobutyrate family transporter YjeM [Lactobacillus sp.]
MDNNKQAKTITMGSLVLMIITSVYGFGNVSVSYAQMSYAAVIWYIFAGLVFMIPSSLMMAEYGSAYPEAKGGIFTWLAGSIGEKWAFIGIFIWLANWVIWQVSMASRIWISVSSLLFGEDKTQTWHIGSLTSTQTVGLLAIAFILITTFLSSRGMKGIQAMSSIGGVFLIALNVLFIVVSIWVLILNHGQLAEPIHSAKAFFHSPNPNFQSPIAVISFVVYAIFAYGGMETVSGVTDSMKDPEKSFPRGLLIGAAFTICSYVLMIFMAGFTVNYQRDIARDGVNIGNMTYVIFHRLGTALGQALGLSAGTADAIGGTFVRFIALATLMGIIGAFFVMLYSPIKSFILGSDERLWPKKLTKLNDHEVPANAIWAQATFVSLMIFFVSFGGSAAKSFYQILQNMVNVSSSASYIFIVGAFPFFLRKDLPRKFKIFTNYRWTTALVVFVELVICAGILFTIIEPILQGDYMTAFWTAIGPIIFGLIAYTFYRISGKEHGVPEDEFPEN